VTVQPPDLVDGTHALNKGPGQLPDSQVFVPASIAVVTLQIDVDEGKDMGVPVAASTLVQDQSSELVSREQEVIP